MLAILPIGKTRTPVKKFALISLSGTKNHLKLKLCKYLTIYLHYVILMNRWPSVIETRSDL